MNQTRSLPATDGAGAADEKRPLSRDASVTRPSQLAELVERVAQHDRDAFAALYNATAPKLYGLVLRMVRRRHVADDLLQDVYTRIWERAGDFDPRKGSPMAWMGTIARNRTLDALRQSASRIAPAGSDGEIQEVAATDMSPLEALQQSEDLKRLMECLGKLDAERREIVLLAYRDGFSRNDLSRRFGHPVGTIKTWLYRSLVQLRACLNQ